MKICRGVSAVLLTLCAVLSMAGCDQNPESSQSLIQAFGGSCRSAGQWTQSALLQNQSIITTIQNIQNNDYCKPFASVLNQIGSASTQIQSLLSDPSYAEYRAAEETAQELTLALKAAAPGSELAMALAQQLTLAQVTLAEKRAGNTSDLSTTKANRFANSTLQFSNYTQSLLQNASGITNCLHHSPEVAVELASNFLTLGGSFISPAYGAGGAIVGQLMALGVEIAKNLAPNVAVMALNQAQVPTALGCALESMTELYCDANDSFDLLKVQANAYSSPGTLPDPIWQSLDLAERRIPVLDQWLLTVRNGTLPSDPQQAQKQNSAWAQLQALDNSYRTIYGEINQDLALYNSAAGNKTAQQNILISAILNVTQILNTGGPSNGGIITTNGPNAFAKLNATADQFSCWLVTGYITGGAVTVCPANNPSLGITGAQYLTSVLLPMFHPSLASLMSNFVSIHEPLLKQIALEFAQTIIEDPVPILASAHQPVVDNLSPQEILERLLQFLKDDLKNDDGSNPQKIYLLNDTIAMVEKGLSIINDKSSAGADLKIRNLFDTFHLANGLGFFDGRIGKFVQWDLQDRLKRGEFTQDVSQVLKVAGGNIRNRLVESGVINVDSVAADLNNARALTASTIQAFRSYFEESFKNSIEMLDEQSRNAREPQIGVDRPFGQTLGHLCTLLLATGQEWPESVSWPICARASLSSVYPDPEGRLNFRLKNLSRELKGKSDRVRMCAYHRFLRAGRLAEILEKNKASVQPAPPRKAREDLAGFLGLAP